MKNQINVYSCKVCGQPTVTVDRDDGTTPMFLCCRATHGCTGTAVSLGYPDWGEGEAPTPEWKFYKPNLRQAHKAGPEMLQHFRLGGLFLRRIPGASFAERELARLRWERDERR